MKRVRRAWRWLRKPENFDVDVAVFVFAVTVACAWLGWGMRPAVGGPPQLPPTPTLNLQFPGPQAAPLDLTPDTQLTQTSDSQAKLQLDVQGTFASGQQAIHWTLAIENFTGFVCTPGLQPTTIGPQNYQLDVTSPVPPNGDVFLRVSLCWQQDSPVTTNNSYISANLPIVQAPGETGTVTRVLQPFNVNTYAYNLSGSIGPSSATAQYWTWQSPLSTSVGSQAAAPITVFGTSIVGVQNASDNTFYSGILFGLAGGGIIALALALPDPLKRAIQSRNAKRKPADKGGTAQESTQGAKA